MPLLEFDTAFKVLTGNEPFPWQRALYKRFESNDIPASCNLPTGLGKTSVIAVWLIAFANGLNVPRRLVYVVNRRTVVDQTTDEVEKYRRTIEEKAELSELKLFLGEALRISTLRGQFADNREWSADPSRPAVICGTVDMIGSRLLFSGYGVGFKSKPLHAGFLGQDALLVHDEAHLEPAFQELLVAIEKEQNRCQDFKPFRVMELTATRRSAGSVFELTPKDHENETVRERIQASKKLFLHALADAKKPQAELARKALEFQSSGCAVLVFVYSVEAVLEIAKEIEKKGCKAITLTGTMRGKERDELVNDPTFGRFLPKPPENATAGTVYLVCTSAGEVGVNISADYLVCDLSTFESMAQRFGRVNRFGKFPECEIHCFYPQEKDWDEKHPLTSPRQKTLALFRLLDGKCVSPQALGELPAADRVAAFAPPPTILPTSDILFDAWALTTIRDKLPGRPPVEPYLHGLPTDWQPPETQVAWREEVSKLQVKPWIEWTPKEFEKYASELLDDYPLKPHELLKDNARRVFDRLKKLKADSETAVWLQSDDGAVEVTTLGKIVQGDSDDLNYLAVILPPEAGGLNAQGMLDDKVSSPASDVADEFYLKDSEGIFVRQRKRLWDTNPENDEDAKDMHSIRSIDFPGSESDEDSNGSSWNWYKLGNEGDKSAKLPVEWSVHVGDVERELERIVSQLALPIEIEAALKTAAKYHDHGKRRKIFQTVLNNRRYPEVILAKSGQRGGRIAEVYRHEFGSLLDIRKEVSQWADESHALLLHLIAAHHGRARPHFPADEAFDPEYPQTDAEELAAQVPRRFAKLQRKYGRWGLAYLESLLRAADWAASGNPSKYWKEGEQ